MWASLCEERRVKKRREKFGDEKQPSVQRALRHPGFVAIQASNHFDKSNFGIHSPGPMVYGAKSTIGASVNTNSKYGNASAFSFGSEDRFAY